jgi:sec-independent protein translocase protein TatA
MSIPLAFFQGIGTTEVIVIAVIALLIFGRRLPEVGRSLGKGIVEFKKGLRGIEDEINESERADDRAPEQLESQKSSTSEPDPARQPDKADASS